MLPSVQRLLQDGHELIGIFSFECDNIFNFNSNTKKLAENLDIPFTQNKPLPIDIDVFVKNNADVFFSAGYPFKIPPINNDAAYGINFHPSMLPKGRGIMPTPTIIMKHPEASGMSVHKLTQHFDEGDILDQMAIPLGADDDVETFSAKLSMRAPDFISRIFKNLPELWKNAKPQDHKKASTFPMPDEKMRLMDWNKTVGEIKKTGQAFGRFGALARFDNKIWAVYNFKGWVEAHHYKPGDIVCVLSREIVIAAKDGFICLKDFQELR